MTYEPPKGASLAEAAKRAIEEAINYDEIVYMTFNEIEVRVFPESCLNDVCEKYYLQNEIRRLKSGY
jgi:hypothetical protein